MRIIPLSYLYCIVVVSSRSANDNIGESHDTCVICSPNSEMGIYSHPAPA